MDLEIYDDTKNVPDEKIKLIEDILNFAGSYLNLPEDTEMSVTLMDNEHIHEINKKYRGVDKPTDVISFAIEEDDPDEVPIILKMKSLTSPKILATSWFQWTRSRNRLNIWAIQRSAN